MPGKKGGVRRWWGVLIGMAIAVLAVPSVIYGPRCLASWARSVAAGQIEAGAISTAQGWLAWSSRLVPNDSRTDLLQAVCFRHQHQEEDWRRTLQLAQKNGVPTSDLEQEASLGMIRSGEVPPNVDEQISALLTNGASVPDIYSCFVHGYLARKEPAKAKLVLDSWVADRPDDPNLAYMRAIYWLWLGDQASGVARRRSYLIQAESDLQSALSREPRHEAARTTLAELLEDQQQFAQALEQLGQLAVDFPTNVPVKVSLAQVLRKLGRLDEARAVIESVASGAAPVRAAFAEMGQIELAAGNLAAAERWFDQLSLNQSTDFTLLNAAATTFASLGKTPRAELLFSQIDTQSVRASRIEDLRYRVATGGGDKGAEDELRRLLAMSAGSIESHALTQELPPLNDQHESPSASASESYSQSCAACHGVNGNGNGRAARHLFPKPRDLWTGKMRLVSTLNGIPTLEDIEAVIENGMPGTSMQGFQDLSGEQRRLLAQEVLRLKREGVRSQMIRFLMAEEEEIDEDEISLVVQECTVPEDVASVPRMGVVDSKAISRGKDTYFALGCHHCHGNDGVGVGDNPVYDEKGRLTRPRDLVHEPFKGGREPESVYLRIVAGMPGSPHPATLGIHEEELVDLVHYCGSLAQEPESILTNFERGNWTSGKSYLAAVRQAARLPSSPTRASATADPDNRQPN